MNLVLEGFISSWGGPAQANAVAGSGSFLDVGDWVNVNHQRIHS